jgi:hypothetical protein
MFFLVEVSLIDNVCRFFKDIFKRTSNFCKNHTDWNFCMRNTLCILIKIKLSHSSHFLRFAKFCGHRKPQIADFADLRNSAKNENPANPRCIQLSKFVDHVTWKLFLFLFDGV